MITITGGCGARQVQQLLPQLSAATSGTAPPPRGPSVRPHPVSHILGSVWLTAPSKPGRPGKKRCDGAKGRCRAPKQTCDPSHSKGTVSFFRFHPKLNTITKQIGRLCSSTKTKFNDEDVLLGIGDSRRVRLGRRQFGAELGRCGRPGSQCKATAPLHSHGR